MSRRSEEVLARNLCHLMELKGWSQGDLARKSGVAQKTISNMLGMRQRSLIASADRVAYAFGLEGWHLMMPTLPEDVRDIHSLERLLGRYVSASPEGREFIDRVAEKEAEYSPKPPPNAD